MSAAQAFKGLQLRSVVKHSGELELSLVEVETPAPKPDEVIVRVEAAPINPSDLGLLFGGADMSTARASGTADRPVVTASVDELAAHQVWLEELDKKSGGKCLWKKLETAG